jgi:hypothetical protein
MTLNLGLNVWVFTALLFVVGIAWGFGKASVFKYIGDEYPHNIGVISGIVGLIGGWADSFPHPLRHAGRFHRHQQQHLHAPLRHHLLVADLDVHHRGARGEDPQADRFHRQGGRGRRGAAKATRPAGPRKRSGALGEAGVVTACSTCLRAECGGGKAFEVNNWQMETAMNQDMQTAAPPAKGTC